MSKLDSNVKRASIQLATHLFVADTFSWSFEHNSCQRLTQRQQAASRRKGYEQDLRIVGVGLHKRLALPENSFI